MAFESEFKVRFANVDPAGIVFYPRYFEFINGGTEDWFASMGMDFRTMHADRHMGVPIVRMECDFVRPSQLGDELRVLVQPVALGRSSCTIEYAIMGADGLRIKAKGVLVCMDLATKKAMPWPESLAAEIHRQIAAGAAA